MADPRIYPKFLRGFYASLNTTGGSQAMLYFLRVVYEFWGFCVNGTNNTQTPGGFSTSHTTGSYIVMPTGWESGSTVLRASGSDGFTQAGTTLFTTLSSKFSASYKGMHISIWESGSRSTDDSIYPIVDWVNSSSIHIDPTYGGTVTHPSGSVPEMTTRTNLNWRVINFAAAAVLTPFPTTGSLVFEFNDAGVVNPGQDRSQFRLAPRATTGDWDDLRIFLSPSGSWNGNLFNGLTASNPEFRMNNSEGGTGGWSSSNFFLGNGGTGYITLIADKTFIIATTGGAWSWNNGQSGDSSGFLVEIPKRLYSQNMDPNPICGLSWGAVGFVTIAVQGYGMASRHVPSPYDPTLRRYQGAMPCYSGWVWERSYHSAAAPQALVAQRYPLYYNPVINTTWLPPTTLYLGWFFDQDSSGQSSVQGRTSIGRVRLRSQRTSTGGIQRLARIQDGANKWIHVAAGVLWPWDHALVPGRMIFRGIGDAFA